MTVPHNATSPRQTSVPPSTGAGAAAVGATASQGLAQSAPALIARDTPDPAQHWSSTFADTATLALTSSSNFREVRETVNQLIADISRTARQSDADLADAAHLMESLKSHQDELRCLKQANDQATIIRLGSAVTDLIVHCAAQEQQSQQTVAQLSLASLHTLCNGLSVCVGSSTGESIFSDSHRATLMAPLRTLNRHLMEHANALELGSNELKNGLLLDVLNWLTRGLNAGLLAADEQGLRRLFSDALDAMAEFTTTTGAPRSGAGQLNSRQLAKALVQIKTIWRHQLVTLDESAEGQRNRSLLVDTVLHLCSGHALHSLCPAVFEQKSRPNPGRTSRPDMVEFTNIANTFKDFLDHGLLSPTSPILPTIVGKLLKLMHAMDTTMMIHRGGQTLGNCCNFLRSLRKAGVFSQEAFARHLPLYNELCGCFLERVADPAWWESLHGAAGQTMANVISFIRSVDEAGAVQKPRLQAAAQMLVQQVSERCNEIQHPESKGGTLAGLQYFLDRSDLLTSTVQRSEASGLIALLLTSINTVSVANWSQDARSALLTVLAQRLRAAERTTSGQASDDLTRDVALMEQLIALRDHECGDPLPYLIAVRQLAGRDSTWLERHASLARALVAAPLQATLSLAVIDARIAALQESARNEARQVTPALAETNATPSTSDSLPATTPAPSPRQIPGLTRVIAPVKRLPQTHGQAQGLASSGSPVASLLPRSPVSNEWKEVVSSAKKSVPSTGSTAPVAGLMPGAAYAPTMIASSSLTALIRDNPEQPSSPRDSSPPLTASRLSTTPPKVTAKSKASKKRKGNQAQAGNTGKSSASSHRSDASSDEPIAVTPALLKQGLSSLKAAKKLWTDLLVQESGDPVEALQALGKRYPELFEGDLGEGQSPVYWALLTGKPKVLRWLMLMDEEVSDIASVDEPVMLINSVIGKLGLVEDHHLAAFRAYLDNLSPVDLSELGEYAQRNFKKFNRSFYDELVRRQLITSPATAATQSLHPSSGIRQTAPLMQAQKPPGRVRLEDALPSKVIARLRNDPSQVERILGTFGSLEAVEILNRMLHSRASRLDVVLVSILRGDVQRAQLCALDQHNETLLSHAIGLKMSVFVRYLVRQAPELLLQFTGQLPIKRTPLMIASQMDDTELVKILLQATEDKTQRYLAVTTENGDQIGAFKLAAMSQSLEVMQLLLDLKDDALIDVGADAGGNALVTAIYVNSDASVAFLLEDDARAAKLLAQPVPKTQSVLAFARQISEFMALQPPIFAQRAQHAQRVVQIIERTEARLAKRQSQ